MKKQILLTAFVAYTTLSHQGPLNPSGVEFSGDHGPCAISEVIDPLIPMEAQTCEIAPQPDPFQD